MEKRLIYFVLAFLLAACGAVSSGDAEADNPFQPSQMAMDAPVVLVLPSATLPPTQTRVLTLTPDWGATIGEAEARNSAAQLNLQYSLGTLTLAAATAQSISSTETALQGRMDATATATVLAGAHKLTQTVAVAQTSEAQALQTESAAATATVQAPLTQKAQVEADWAPFWSIFWACAAMAVGLLVMFYASQIGYQLVRLVYDKRVALRQPEPAQEPVIDTVGVKLDRRDAYGWGAVDRATLPIDMATLQQVAELLTTGSRFTQAQMTGAGRPLVKDGSYGTFGDWLVQWGIAEKIDGRYTIVHPEFFEQVLKQ